MTFSQKKIAHDFFTGTYTYVLTGDVQVPHHAGELRAERGGARAGGAAEQGDEAVHQLHAGPQQAAVSRQAEAAGKQQGCL